MYAKYQLHEHVFAIESKKEKKKGFMGMEVYT